VKEVTDDLTKAETLQEILKTFDHLVGLQTQYHWRYVKSVKSCEFTGDS